MKNQMKNTMEKARIIGTMDRKLKRTKAAVSLLCSTAVIVGSTVTAFAAPGADAGASIVSSISSLTDIIFSVLRAVGLILTGLGVFNVGSSFTSHDASQRSQGFMLVGGGLIIFFVKEILAGIGVSI